MTKMTLRQVCEETGISRRAIQGYEKAGLICPDGRTERGYLLYSQRTIEKMILIKLLQNLGFTVKEIRGLIEGPKPMMRIAVEKAIINLKKKKEDIDDLIKEGTSLIDKL